MSELPRLEAATPEDLHLAVSAVGSLAIYGGFLRAALAAIYAERERLVALRGRLQQARKDYYEQALDHGEKTGHGEQEARAYGRVEMCDEVLGWLAGSGTEGDTGIRTSVQWAVAYGSPQGDPNESAGILEYDDEADAREHLQWTVDGFLARRTVTSTRWERVEAGTPAPEGEH